jgi:hypothetical protein
MNIKKSGFIKQQEELLVHLRTNIPGVREYETYE